MKILITGGFGYLGTGMAKLLSEKGYKIRILSIHAPENYQEKDGSIKIPRVLHKYMGGIKKIQPQKIKKKK